MNDQELVRQLIADGKSLIQSQSWDELHRHHPALAAYARK